MIFINLQFYIYKFLKTLAGTSPHIQNPQNSKDPN